MAGSNKNLIVALLLNDDNSVFSFTLPLFSPSKQAIYKSKQVLLSKSSYIPRQQCLLAMFALSRFFLGLK